MRSVSSSSPIRDTSAPLPPTRSPGKRGDAGGFTRAPADGVWKPFNGHRRTTVPTAPPVQPQFGAETLAMAGANVSAFFRMFTESTGAPRNEIPFVFRNGDTAVISGDNTSQRIQVQTRGGAVQEAMLSANGPVIVRGFQTPDELNRCFTEFLSGSGWTNARALP